MDSTKTLIAITALHTPDRLFHIPLIYYSKSLQSLPKHDSHWLDAADTAQCLLEQQGQVKITWQGSPFHDRHHLSWLFPERIWFVKLRTMFWEFIMLRKETRSNTALTRGNSVSLSNPVVSALVQYSLDTIYSPCSKWSPDNHAARSTTVGVIQ